MTHKFKVGQKVKIIANDDEPMFDKYIGRITKIKSTMGTSTSKHQYILHLEKGKPTMWGEVELVNADVIKNWREELG